MKSFFCLLQASTVAPGRDKSSASVTKGKKGKDSKDKEGKDSRSSKAQSGSRPSSQVYERPLFLCEDEGGRGWGVGSHPDFVSDREDRTNYTIYAFLMSREEP